MMRTPKISAQKKQLIGILALVPALRAGPSQKINLYYSNHEYIEHMHVTSTVGELLS